ncbi:MAG: M23 family metallopeptidase [Nitrososphaerales archaeon]
MRSIATFRILRFSPRSCIANGLPRRVVVAAALACLALCLWLGDTRAAFAGDLVIDLRPRPPWVTQLDDSHGPAGAAGGTATYRSQGSGSVERLRLSPWPPRQGQTLIVTVQARRPVTFSLAFLGRVYPVHGASLARWALAPIPALAKPGDAPLTLRAGDQQLVVDVPVTAGTFETINIPAATSLPILSNTAKVNAEAVRMAKLFAATKPGPWNPAALFTPPLHGAFRHTSAFGSRRTYGKDPTLSAHAGEDYSAAAGTPVYAPADGVVVLAEKLFVRGNAIVLDHGNGVFTGYWHLSEIGVKPGERVEAGQGIGKVGTTGLSTGAHLHWEMRVEGEAVDPLQWVGK